MSNSPFMYEELLGLGLTANEAKVYLALLEIGECTVGPIINKLNIHRQIAYNALEGLVEKRLVGKKIKGKRYHFSIANPNNLMNEIKRKEAVASDLIVDIKKQIKTQRKGQEIKVYEGTKAFREYILENDTRTPAGESVYVVTGATFKYLEALGERNFARSNELRTKKGITTKVIFPEALRENIKTTERGLSEYRFLRQSSISPTAFQICHDSVILISYGSDIFFIQIKNEDFRLTYLNYFDALWKQAIK